MVASWIGNRFFSILHQRNLVYNTCWEDPRIDREALRLTPGDTVLVITSAGCNALDYALQGPKKVFAVDMNPLQNSLLELKRAAIRGLDQADFFQVFGHGHHPRWSSIYHDAVRPHLTSTDQVVWDRRVDFFDGSAKRQSFYFRGTSGFFAWLINGYLNRPAGLKEAISEILEAESVEQQQEIYDSRRINDLLWSKPLRWTLRRNATMAMLGVPRSQRNQLDRDYPGGVAGFIQDRIETVFKKIPLKDNYFWRVYLTGRYTPECCPEYLNAANFDVLKNGIVDRIETCHNTVEGFLTSHEEPISRFVLLDHMDWLYDRFPEKLTAEWQSILSCASANARILWRSAALSVDFVDSLVVKVEGRSVRIGDLLKYQPELASELHDRDRVNTYGSFYIADLNVAATRSGVAA